MRTTPNVKVHEGSATRVDPDAGIEETVEFVDLDGQRMFAARQVPTDGAAAGVVICPSIHAEFHRNYRREVELARHLARERIAVQRFHYRGTGHSDGNGSALTINSMVEDALSAASRLRGMVSLDRIGFLGTRCGAIVAAAAAAQSAGAPLALWEPITDGRRFFREVFRVGLIHELRKGMRAPRSGSEQLEELKTGGTLDVLGYAIGLDFYDSLFGRRLDDELGGPARPLLLVEIGRGPDLRREYSIAAAKWTNRGFDVATEVVTAMPEPWWFVRGRSIKEEAMLLQQLLDVTGSWFVRTLSPTREPG